MVKQGIFSLIFLMAAQGLFSLDDPGREIRLTGTELGLTFRAEYNRVFYFRKDFALTGAAELNNRYRVQGGLSLGDGEFSAFAGGEAALMKNFPLYLRLSYIYNGFLEYQTHIHSALPLVSLRGQRAGITVGPGLRLSSFFGEPPVFESMLSFSAYVNLITGRPLRLGLHCANFSSFNAGNMGAYSLRLSSLIRLNERCALVNELELLQSGSVGLSASFYGAAFRGGLIILW